MSSISQGLQIVYLIKLSTGTIPNLNSINPGNFVAHFANRTIKVCAHTARYFHPQFCEGETDLKKIVSYIFSWVILIFIKPMIHGR